MEQLLHGKGREKTAELCYNKIIFLLSVTFVVSGRVGGVGVVAGRDFRSTTKSGRGSRQCRRFFVRTRPILQEVIRSSPSHVGFATTWSGIELKE